MSKIKIKMKLTGFELEIEGSREDVPAISQSLGRQLAGLMQPPDAIIDGKASHDLPPAAAIFPALDGDNEVAARRKPRRRRAVSPAGVTDVEDSSAVDWRHDASKYGSPSQSWNTANKALWTLYVVAQETDEKELSGRRIAATFNKHFRQAKAVTVTNVNRDLGRLKLKKQSHVSEDTTKNPSAWYLTEEGNKHVQGLIAEALGRKE
ncbi:hypothetical protein ACN9M1_06410 [Ralstonia sp. R-29]|uniref:hypothetical protein n=1 Tax=Ralstonia sp. R-29 TaxID=3404059 RepID=UPI003CF7CA0B